LRGSVSIVRRLFLALVVAIASPSIARAQDVDATPSPPMAPFKRGVLVEGSIGMYAPTGRLKNYSSPGPWMRVSLGYDLSKWLAAFVSGDCAFLSTDRAPPPPGDRGYLLYGFGLGARLSIPASERIRFPLRVELGGHRVADAGVLGTYLFGDARGVEVSYGATAGIEWRAPSRHFGIILEGGVRNDTGLSQAGRSDGPLAVVTALSLHSTL